MNTTKQLKYTVIKSHEQYDKYCKMLEDLISMEDPNVYEEIELITALIEKWDHEHNSFSELDPVELLKALMDDHNLKSKDIAEILHLSKGTVSKILNYHKGFSKKTIRKLAEYFKISQDAFNRPYILVLETKRHHQDVN